MSISLFVSFLFRAKKIEKDFELFGYIGAIVSMGMIGFLPYSYQHTVSYVNFSRIYELSNKTVALDSVLYGKLPIIDYFSAHALSDVWTRILYCFIHGDIKGIFADPYGGLSTILGFIILFFIIKNFFDRDSAILFVFLFPGIVTGIKFVSICSLSIAMLLYIVKNPGIRQYVLFWIAVLISAFTIYDEGISLGLACIFAYVIVSLIQKEWRNLKIFIISGILVGASGSILYVIYGLFTGMDFISRIKEWISVSIGSNSTWATESFGDVSSIAFLFSYFVVPVMAIVILFITIYRFYKTNENATYAVITIAFAITELIYIPRTIVYHNLAVCSGITGVLLNFIHWTVSSYLLYVLTIRGKKENTKVFVWGGAMLVVIILEGALVTNSFPDANSVLLSRSIMISDNWELRNNMTENWNQDRIIYDDETTLLISQFKNVFDMLLEENETFLDFANITSMYAFTGRIRPCYVSQSPSLLTDLYSQKCFLEEITEYNCPLVVIGTTESGFLQQMVGIPHNVRYYKIAEHIYANYRPLISFGEFAIWCAKESYDDYNAKLRENGFVDMGYVLIDYGYDATVSNIDENGNKQYIYTPYHSYDLDMIPFIWANHDDYGAIDNEELVFLDAQDENFYVFSGSQSVVCNEGNYLAFECTNNLDENLTMDVVFLDSTNECIRYQYGFTVLPGTNQYIIRASEDYFWDVFNIDRIMYMSNSDFEVKNVRILQGD